MSDAKHTPGPWRVSMGRTVAHVVGGNGHGICGVNTTPLKGARALGERRIYRERALADAQLIAMAPDLLAGDWRGFAEAMQKIARAALAPAKQEP